MTGATIKTNFIGLKEQFTSLFDSQCLSTHFIYLPYPPLINGFEEELDSNDEALGAYHRGHLKSTVQDKQREREEGNPVEKKKRQNSRRVIRCLKNPEYDFRTVKGIAQELGIDESEVREVLNNPKEVRKSWATNGNGDELFTHVDRKITFRERIAVVQDILSRPFQKSSIWF